MLTVYGIETYRYDSRLRRYYRVATVLTVYGIETCFQASIDLECNGWLVATVLTVYGIETLTIGRR